MELVDPNLVNITTNDYIIAGETYCRSSIIQQLSLLMGFLNWSSPAQPNSSIATKLRGVIKKVLDHVLNHTRRPQTPVVDVTTHWGNFGQFNLMDGINWFSQDWGTEEPIGMH